MSDLGDRLKVIRQRAIDSGELTPDRMLAADEIRPYRDGWLDEYRELKRLRGPREPPHCPTCGCGLPANDTGSRVERWRKFDGAYRKTWHLAREPGGKVWAAWPNAGRLNAGHGGVFEAGDNVEFRECSFAEYEAALQDDLQRTGHPR